jgi:hypothetical protein
MGWSALKFARNAKWLVKWVSCEKKWPSSDCPLQRPQPLGRARREREKTRQICTSHFGTRSRSTCSFSRIIRFSAFPGNPSKARESPSGTGHLIVHFASVGRTCWATGVESERESGESATEHPTLSTLSSCASHSYICALIMAPKKPTTTAEVALVPLKNCLVNLPPSLVALLANANTVSYRAWSVV